jgi:2-oxo-4-hydroxy-4-carboxy-5-ureidoimidazoline decarboxylase
MSTVSLSTLNTLNSEDAVALLGGVFEHSPWIVAETWPQAPFGSVEGLHQALVATMLGATPDQQLNLIRAHPDLVGAAARSGSLTKESTAEQRAAGLGVDDLTPDEVVAFTELNATYQARFGFPFVICARENRKASILAGFAARLPNDAETEREMALREIARIAWYRIQDLVADD